MYNHNDHSVPVVLVIKVGGIGDKGTKQPGNRGKRDSQVILMNFLCRVMFDDRMSPLDYELFSQIRKVTGNTPDVYETILSLDSDTVIAPKSLRYMINAMINDEKIMALCGESQIANKMASWVTTIQVTNNNLTKARRSLSITSVTSLVKRLNPSLVVLLASLVAFQCTESK